MMNRWIASLTTLAAFGMVHANQVGTGFQGSGNEVASAIAIGIGVAGMIRRRQAKQI